ncbi:MAG: acyl-ACP--UDP-N-acetylglucosamine O-acyltransferase, partial [Pseudomonadota bacterium]
MSSSTNALIHPTACIDENASLGADVRVGPYAVIEADVSVGDGTVVGPHCVLRRWTRLGKRNQLAAHVVLGEAPQHRAYDGAQTWLEIGDDNVMREGVTIHRAFEQDAATRVGSRCYLMAYSHIAHDCLVGNDVTMTNYVAIAGHVEVGDFVTFGGGALIHQFVRIGAYAMVGGQAAVRKDLLPYTLSSGDPCRHYRLNSIGLRRNGITGERYRALEHAVRTLRGPDGLAALSAQGDSHSQEVNALRAFIAASQRGVS